MLAHPLSIGNGARREFSLFDRLDFFDGDASFLSEGDLLLHSPGGFPPVDFDDDELFAKGQDGKIEFHPVRFWDVRRHGEERLVVRERRKDKAAF